MISKLVVTLVHTSDKNLNYNISSLLHGALMELISSDHAGILHETGLKPYSQYMEFDKNTINWNIHTLSQEARTYIIDPLMNEKINAFHIKHKDLDLVVTNKTVSDMTYRQLIDEKYFKDGSRIINIQFLTPCSFKSQGRYVYYPTLPLIYQSLMNKFDACSDVFKMKSEEILDDLCTYSEIIDYNLRSTRFHLEGVRIPSFLGKIRIKVNGPQPMVNLVNTLLTFGEYSGVGIKSAIGMGGMHLIL